MYLMPELFGTNEKGLVPSPESVDYCEELFLEQQSSICRGFLPADFVGLLCDIVWQEFQSEVTICNCTHVYKRLVDILCLGDGYRS